MANGLVEASLGGSFFGAQGLVMNPQTGKMEPARSKRQDAIANGYKELDRQQNEADQLKVLKYLGIPEQRDAKGYLIKPDPQYVAAALRAKDPTLAAQWFGDDPSKIGVTVSLPDSEKAKALAAFIDPNTHQIDPSRMAEFDAMAQELGIRKSVNVNGITNEFNQAWDTGRIIAKETGAIVVNVYNPTEGMVDDLFECLAGLMGVEHAAVLATRETVQDAQAYNAAMDEKAGNKEPTVTEVFGHSEGTIIANLAVREIADEHRKTIGLYNIGTAAHEVPTGLAYYHNVVNTRDYVAWAAGAGFLRAVGNGIGKLFGVENAFGGAIEHSSNFLQEQRADKDYTSTWTTFDIKGTNNHSFYLYANDEVARQALGWKPVPAMPYQRSWLN